MQPTLAGFLNFVRQVMGITTAQLPDASPVIGFALSVALGIVNPALRAACIPQTDGAGVQLNMGGLSIYVLAVYNLAGSNLLSYAQDPEPPVVYKDNLPFFEYTRKRWKIDSFVSGVVQASSDESTSVSLVVPEAFKNLTIANLTSLKDPYGRAYMGLAQSYGPTGPWGIS
jgi:hypothetical protein